MVLVLCVCLALVVIGISLFLTKKMDIEEGKGKEQENQEEKPLPQRSGGLLSWLGGTLGGAYTKEPEALQDAKVSAKLKAFIEEKLSVFEESDFPLVDYHTHVFGVGAGGTGCACCPEFFNGSVKKRLTGEVFFPF